jgi:hypothetical protein
MLIPVIGAATVVALLTVTVFTALATPSAAFPNARLAGVSVRFSTPVPLNDTVCGLVMALCTSVKFPVRGPAPFGLKRKVMAQVRLGARVAGLTGHVLVWVNSPAAVLPVGLTAMLLIVSRILCLLVTVSVVAALTVPAVWLANGVMAVNVTGAVAVPVKGTVCGLPGALLVIVKSPFRTPSPVGLNATLIEHVPAGAILPAQLLVPPKSGNGMPSPLNVAESVNGSVPVFRTVIAVVEEVLPTGRLPKLMLVGESDTADAPSAGPITRSHKNPCEAEQTVRRAIFDPSFLAQPAPAKLTESKYRMLLDPA